jgi:hypothetical protein
MKGREPLIICGDPKPIYERRVMDMKLIEEEKSMDRVSTNIRDAKTKIEYGRIVGGLAWPSPKKPGFAVVVAEDYDLDAAVNARHMRVLAEAEASDLSDLFRRCLELQEDCLNKYRWYGDIENKAMMDFLFKLNKESGTRTLYLAAARYIEASNGLKAYMDTIRTLTRAHQKTLHFGPESKLSAYLQEFNEEDMGKSASEFPPLAALGYAVSELFHNEPLRKSGKKKPMWRRYV